MNKKLNTEHSFTEITARRMTTPETVSPPDMPVYILKRIGSTTYKVAVYFNHDTSETANDKIACLIRNETVVSKLK